MAADIAVGSEKRSENELEKEIWDNCDFSCWKKCLNCLKAVKIGETVLKEVWSEIFNDNHLLCSNQL